MKISYNDFMIKIKFILIIVLSSYLCAISSYMELSYVKKFYDIVAPISVELGDKYNVPPAVIMAIAGIESGYGRGYVSKITGNVLSLGAKKGEKELPSLILPTNKGGKVLYNSQEISTYDKDELKYKKRPKSLKKDYRPSGIAGTNKQLDYFDKNKQAKTKAIRKNILDFVTKWVSYNHSYKPFQNARAYLDKNKDKIFTQEVAKKFISLIGGVPNGFNYRKSWVTKVNIVMKKAHLIELANDLKRAR